MLGGIESVGEAHADFRLQIVVVGLVKLRRGHSALRLAGLLAQVFNGSADFLDLGVGEFDRVHNLFFFHFFRARLDHQDGVGGADDHDVQQAFAHLRIRGIGDEASVHQTDAHGADRSEEGNVREGERRGGGVDADDVGIVLCVSGQNKNNDLCFAAKTLGKHRPDGAVDLAAGEHFALAHAAFALDEPPGIRPPA